MMFRCKSFTFQESASIVVCLICRTQTYSFICNETKAAIQNLKDGHTTDHKNKFDDNPGKQKRNVQLQLSK